MDTISPIVALGSLVIAFTNVMRMVSGKEWSGVATQLLAWAAGIGAVMLTAQTNIADAIPIIGGSALSHANIASQILVGLMAASTGGVVVNLTKAIDGTDTARFPKLLNGRTNAPPPSQ